MGTYGRNFDFRQSPLPQHRLGRYKTGASAIPIGAPVIVDEAAGTDPDGRLTFELAPAGTPRPNPGQGGICLWEVPDNNFVGQDAMLTRPSDIIDAPANTPAQLVHGTEVRLLLVNTEDFSFQTLRDYTGRIMVAGLGATPTVEVGSLLGPGDGNDNDGYWQTVVDEADAWAYVTGVAADAVGNGFAGFVEAQLLF